MHYNRVFKQKSNISECITKKPNKSKRKIKSITKIYDQNITAKLVPGYCRPRLDPGHFSRRRCPTNTQVSDTALPSDSCAVDMFYFAPDAAHKRQILEHGSMKQTTRQNNKTRLSLT